MGEPQTEKKYEFDKEGFLTNLELWNENIAKEIAQQDLIFLTEKHWEIIYLVREFYRTFQLSPSMRALVKHTERCLGKEKGNSLYLLHLFPSSPAKYACKIAGLPKPANCI